MINILSKEIIQYLKNSLIKKIQSFFVQILRTYPHIIVQLQVVIVFLTFLHSISILKDIPYYDIIYWILLIVIIICFFFLFVFNILEKSELSRVNIELSKLSDHYSSLLNNLETQKAITRDICNSLQEVRENNTYEIKEIIRDFCLLTLLFGSPDANRGYENNSERLTFYYHNNSLKSFNIFFRFSKNPKYDKKGRVSISDDFGVISEAWKNSEKFWTCVPFKENKEKYLNIQKETWKINKGDVNKFSMKSCYYYGYRLDDKKRNPIGVFILESTNPDRYKPDLIKHLFNEFDDSLQKYVDAIHMEHKLHLSCDLIDRAGTNEIKKPNNAR